MPAGDREPTPPARGLAVERDHSRVAELLTRRRMLLTLLAEDEGELRTRGVELDAVSIFRPVEHRGDHRVSIAEAAQALSVSKRTAQRWAEDSGCGWKSPTGRWVVDLPALREWRGSPA
ncbi:hypothetical protein [Methylobacterium sp. J-070]|uniref:hypothetical protein n=1 Tax=Methylobacterium sp. J-070 TaxID=2836650 RepID=UPI001FBAFBCE|nr:hypothetical protein [Methylobacterium sp. J-070]MCJ2051258.1 hypothetical protein [Methylobacterium sp. J-070]